MKTKEKATFKGWDSEFWVKLLKISVEEIIAPLYLGKYKTLHELNSSCLCCAAALISSSLAVVFICRVNIHVAIVILWMKVCLM